MGQTDGGKQRKRVGRKNMELEENQVVFRHRFCVIQFAGGMGCLWWGLECPGVGESGMCSALYPSRSDIVKQNIVIFLAGGGGEP